jgi:GNAT superfamily N-acetyltransferase
MTAADAAKSPILSLFEGAEVAGFRCTEPDLTAFLCEDAERLHRERASRVYVAAVERAVIGYIAVSADVLILKSGERRKMGFKGSDPMAMPGIKVGRLAVDERYEHRGIGTRLMRVAFDIANTTSQTIGCRLLTVDAMPSALSFYEKLGFEENKAVPRRADTAGKIYPDSTISMRLDLRSENLPPWTRFAPQL